MVLSPGTVLYMQTLQWRQLMTSIEREMLNVSEKKNKNKNQKASSRPESEVFSKPEVMRKETDLSFYHVCPWLCLTPAQPARKKSWVTLRVARSEEAPPLFSLMVPILSLSQIFSSHPGGSDSKASAYKARDLGSIPVSGRSSGEGNGNPLWYSCLENPMDGGAW